MWPPLPRLLNADEPTSDLDLPNARKIMSLLADLTAKGLALLLVIHDQELAGCADRLLMMTDGRLEER